MSFDIHQRLFHDGELDEDAAEEYSAALVDIFLESPEGQALLAEGAEPGWVETMIDYALRYLGVTPAMMRRKRLGDIVFELIPRVCCEPSEASAIVREPRAFFTFAECAFALPRNALVNPANLGMDKSAIVWWMNLGFGARVAWT